MGAATPEQWKKMTLDERRKNRMAAYSEREKQIEAVLTAEQKDKYERMVAERRARLGAFIATHPAPPAPPVK